MIRVELQPEPADFDKEVRTPGLKWLKQHGIPPRTTLPPGTSLLPFWRECLGELYAAYGGVCAYLAVFFERCTGTGGVDHFVPKSTQPRLAYEWANYRLACLAMNSLKRDSRDVLDPFGLREGTFRLELVTGRIYSNPELSQKERAAADATIGRLKLDSFYCREMRACHLEEFITGSVDSNFLRAKSPFVWAEASRQGLL